MLNRIDTLTLYTYHLSAEDFGTAWAEDDETDCPKPVPPPDMCDLMGLTAEKPGYEQHVADILKKSPFLKCADVVDQAPFAAQAVQETCMCFDVSCACTILDQLAGECKAKGSILTGGNSTSLIASALLRVQKARYSNRGDLNQHRPAKNLPVVKGLRLDVSVPRER